MCFELYVYIPFTAFPHLNDKPNINPTCIEYSSNTECSCGVTVSPDYCSCSYYMPHGMDVDSHGNMWITDVALHQVMKTELISVSSVDQQIVSVNC